MLAVITDLLPHPFQWHRYLFSLTEQGLVKSVSLQRVQDRCCVVRNIFRIALLALPVLQRPGSFLIQLGRSTHA
jgi:hypothetical protein